MWFLLTQKLSCQKATEGLGANTETMTDTVQLGSFSVRKKLPFSNTLKFTRCSLSNSSTCSWKIKYSRSRVRPNMDKNIGRLFLRPSFIPFLLPANFRHITFRITAYKHHQKAKGISKLQDMSLVGSFPSWKCWFSSISSGPSKEQGTRVLIKSRCGKTGLSTVRGANS